MSTTTRSDTLAALRVAGYHNDQRARVRLLVENRISREAADKAWATGGVQRRQGMPCGCLQCKEAFHANVRQQERLLNAGCLTNWDAATGRTTWTVASQVVGQSVGQVGATTGYINPPATQV
jgi:hypothetical protein